jgi:hypothetical protein
MRQWVQRPAPWTNHAELEHLPAASMQISHSLNLCAKAYNMLDIHLGTQRTVVEVPDGIIVLVFEPARSYLFGIIIRTGFPAEFIE